jgi:hypothetical protein
MRIQAAAEQDAEFGCARLGRDCSKVDMGRDRATDRGWMAAAKARFCHKPR